MEHLPSKLALYLGLSRPRTLVSSLAPVLVATVYAWSRGYELAWGIVLLLILVAVSAQIASNVANDLLDYRKGADTAHRQGPLRPLSRGLLREREVIVVLIISIAILLASGLGVAWLTSWHLVVVGLLVVLALLAYSGGPYPLAYNGLGEVAVLVFFGWVPVITSYYVLTGIVWDSILWHLATSIGLASINILVVNNYRDYSEDKSVGKRTILVRLGRDFAHPLYLACLLLSGLLLYPLLNEWGFWLLLIYLGMGLRAYKGLRTLSGAELNRILSATARNVFVLVLTILTLILMQTDRLSLL